MVICQCFLKAKFSPVEGLAGTAGLATALFPDLCCGVARGKVNWTREDPVSRLEDAHGRVIDYLRVSVTDRCNFRCVYCMPPEGVRLIPRHEILSRDEILKVARVFAGMGGRKIKLTGGEPLVRHDILGIVAGLSCLGGLRDLGLTTNGSHLAPMAMSLRAAGLHRVNVSLDSFNPCRFTELTRTTLQKNVLDGIEAALDAGLRVKINAVVLKGLSDGEIEQFGYLAKSHDIDVRFIEFMPLCGTGWHPEWMLPLAEVEARMKSFFELTPLERGTNTAKTFSIKGGLGRVGFIASMTEPFCGKCSRMRLTANGLLKPCLFSNTGIDLCSPLRAGAGDAELARLIVQAVRQKPIGHGLNELPESAAGLPQIRSFGG